jgi:uncharacterized membrane protein
MNRTVIRFLLFMCCTVGVVLSSLSLHNHYGAAATEYCDLSTMFNCDLVNRSVYSRIFGVPVALIGLFGYVFLIGLSAHSNRLLASFRLAAAVVGLGFALYLAYIEAYVIGVWCLLCIGSLLMISAITALAGIALHQTWKTEPADHGS